MKWKYVQGMVFITRWRVKMDPNRYMPCEFWRPEEKYSQSYNVGSNLRTENDSILYDMSKLLCTSEGLNLMKLDCIFFSPWTCLIIPWSHSRSYRIFVLAVAASYFIPCLPSSLIVNLVLSLAPWVRTMHTHIKTSTLYHLLCLTLHVYKHRFFRFAFL